MTTINTTGDSMTTLPVIPAHLPSWQGPHLAWLAAMGRATRYAPPDVPPVRAYLADANLTNANLAHANLAHADLTGADLADADLSDADLTGADLTNAYLARADLAGADLAGATMPDGRPREAYAADPLAGICHTPEARTAAEAATGHDWQSCPMHAALGISGLGDVEDPALRLRVAAFVAIFDAHLLWGGR